MSISEAQARKIILEKIKTCNKPIARKDFIRDCVISLNVPLEQYETPGGDLNKVKCVLGKLLQQYIRTGIIIESETGVLQYSTAVETKVANRDIEIENILLSMTTKNVYERDILLDSAYAEYRKKHPKSNVNTDEKNAIRGDIGRVLNRLASDDVIPRENDKFGFKLVSRRETMKQAIATISDEEFVTKTIEMLTSYFNKQGASKVISTITDGPDDDGVDGVITLPDKFLGNDEIIIQVKHRKNNNKNEPLKEIRGFAGVLAVQNKVYKGIYVTSAKFHLKVNDFLKNYSIKHLLLIDGEKWLDMAESCGYSL